MFFDRQNNQRDKQLAYRRQLLQQIQQRKHSKIKPSRDTDQYPFKQQFGLIKNIQTQQQARKNKQRQFMAQFKQQMEAQKQRKKRQKQQKIRRQLEEQQKIKQQNQVLRQRYEAELSKEGKKKHLNKQHEIRNQQNIQQNEQPRKTNVNQMNQNKAHTQGIQYQQQYHQQYTQHRPNFKNYPTDSIDNIERIGTSASQNRPNHYGQYTGHNSQGNLPHYQPAYERIEHQPRLFAHRIQNQEFNNISRPRESYKNSYYKQIIGHKKLLQEEASSISQLNAIFSREKYRRKENVIDRGNLEDLRKLSLLLQQKQSSYQRPLYSNPYNKPQSIGNNQYSSPANLLRKQGNKYLNLNINNQSRRESLPNNQIQNQDNQHDDKWYRLD